ncbi:hypothetical protein GCM10010294_70780 [Streptomyces griseoloalbus]|nr:hypothetical protein GCM10010294_70780 [Streptomyces griseoloalbus]
MIIKSRKKFEKIGKKSEQIVNFFEYIDKKIIKHLNVNLNI